MSLCDLARNFPLFSTVEKQSGIVKAANFPIFHTPFKGVEKWKSRRRPNQ
jgi:hypothetical protein